MFRKKQFSLLVILSLLLPVFSIISVENQVNASYQIPIELEGLVTNAIVTETFTGTTNITAFVGPDNAYEIVLSSIKNAQTSFYLEVYTLSSEPLVNELIRAHGRGVDVIVQLSDDRVNSYEDDYTEESAWRLDNAGIDVYWTSGSFTFTHAKFWIVDSQQAFVYSGNWAPSSIPQYEGARKNREMGFIFNDAAIATYYEDVFFDDNLIATAYVSAAHTGTLQANETSGTYEHPFDYSTVVEYAEVTPIFAPDNAYDLLSNLVQSATISLDLELQYMKFDCDLLDDVIDAALRGVAVRVLIPEPGVANENVTEELINNGAQVRFFKGLGHNHNKYVSVDGETVQISSINWSNNSLENNREAGAIVKNSNIAAYLKTVFDYDWANSEVPEGYAAPVALVSPKVGGIASGDFNFQASFAVNTYTEGEIFIDGTSKHVWSAPDGIVGINIDTDSYGDGIHTVKIVGTPTVGDPIEVESKINIINLGEWNLLITEVRYDADVEPNDEFVEVYNGFEFAIYLEGWSLTDNEGEYNLPVDAQIAADEVLIFCSDNAAYQSAMSVLGVTAPTADYGLGDIQLANSGDEIMLKDPADATKDGVAWGSGSVPGVTTWSGDVTDEDKTLQREYGNVDTDNCNDDFVVTDPTPGDVPDVTPEYLPLIALPILSVAALVVIFIRKRK
ncbi:MAG: phospholipase D-like domain-containing protein [Candidatus Heimdallarchaeaceae archaeon]